VTRFERKSAHELLINTDLNYNSQKICKTDGTMSKVWPDLPLRHNLKNVKLYSSVLDYSRKTICAQREQSELRGLARTRVGRKRRLGRV